MLFNSYHSWVETEPQIWKCERCGWSLPSSKQPAPEKTLILMEMVLTGKVHPGGALSCDEIIIYKIMES